MVVGGRELIDTLWNVNRVNTVSMVAIATELIDTLWNVNYPALNEYGGILGINRYIMECKCTGCARKSNPGCRN